MSHAAPDRTNVFANSLGIVALCSFAVAAPLLDIIGQYPEFLVAHQTSLLGVLTLAVAVAILPPGALILLDLGAWSMGPRAHRFVHLGTVAVLASVLVLPPLNRVLSSHPMVLLASAGLLGVGIAGLVARIPALRTYVSILAIGLVIFPVKFLFFSPVSKILFSQGDAVASSGMTLETPHDVVVLVLDEMDTGILLDQTGNIDAQRFPNFARFASEAYWFRKATAVDHATMFAVPAIVSGTYPKPGLLATFEDYPATLLSFLSHTHALHVSEAVTDLLPPLFREVGGVDGGGRVSTLVSDLAVIFGHVVLPADLAETLLASVASGWKGFGGASVAEEEADACGTNSQCVYVAQVETFIDGITRGARPTLHFLHVLLPHRPYTLTSTGKFYAPDNGLDGLVEDPNTGRVHRWIDDQGIVDLARQRYLLQTGFTDRLLGRIIERLEGEGIYDDSMIVVTADHGVSFRAGESNRAFTASNYRELLTVPMLVKLPGQRTGTQSDAYVESIDVLPTVLEVLGATPLPRFDGRSMITGSFSDRTEKQVWTRGRMLPRVFDYEGVTSFPLLSRQLDVLGSETALTDLSPAAVHGELLGRPVAEQSVEVSADVVFELDQPDALRQVDLQSSFVPLYQSGRLREPTNYQLPIEVALAVNGIIASTTQLSSAFGPRPEFRAVLPESSLVQGHNELEIYLIGQAEDGDEVTLTRGRLSPAAPTGGSREGDGN